jgi:hypothetical protein
MLGVAAERAATERRLGMRVSHMTVHMSMSMRMARSTDGGVEGGIVIGVDLIVARDVAGHFRPFELVGVSFEDGGLDFFASARVDRVGDVGVELGSPVGVADRSIFVESGAALVAKAAAEVVFGAAMRAPIGEFPRRHRDEETLGALDDLEVANDEHVVKGDAAKGLQPFVASRVVFHELDADFGDIHGRYSFTWRTRLNS